MQKLVFENVSSAENMLAQVLDHDTVGSDDPIGQIIIPVSSMVKLIGSGNSSQWFKFSGQDAGDGEIKLGFEVAVSRREQESAPQRHPQQAYQLPSEPANVNSGDATADSGTVPMLSIRILEARNLTAADFGNSSDPSTHSSLPHSLLSSKSWKSCSARDARRPVKRK